MIVGRFVTRKGCRRKTLEPSCHLPRARQNTAACLWQRPKSKETGNERRQPARLTLPVGPRTPPARSATLKRRSCRPKARPLDNRHTTTGRWSSRRTRRETTAATPRPRIQRPARWPWAIRTSLGEAYLKLTVEMWSSG